VRFAINPRMVRFFEPGSGKAIQGEATEPVAEIGWDTIPEELLGELIPSHSEAGS
jgi:hypothetical protein